MQASSGLPSEQAMPLTQQLDALWHFDCVVSPRSPSPASLPSTPSPPPSSPKPADGAESPRSPARAGKRPSATTGPRLPAALSSPASKCLPAAAGPHSQAASSSTTARRQTLAASPVSLAQAAGAGKQVLRRVFCTFDENGDGRVSVGEIARIFDLLGIPTCSSSSMESLLRGQETAAQGHLNEEEFLRLYESVCCFVDELDTAASEGSSEDNAIVDEDKDLLAAFHVFDKDGNGFISPSELQTVLCSLGFSQGHHLDACVTMIARIDENGDGQVDFCEFKKLFHLEDPFMPSSIETF